MLLLRIRHGGDAFVHTNWASKRKKQKMSGLASARGVFFEPNRQSIRQELRQHYL
jgi:hypothetical protein